jgi:hypothetical protein
MWDADVEVIYFLMRHCPDALGRLPRVLSPTKDNASIMKDQATTVDVSSRPAETSAVLGTTASDDVDERLEGRKSLEDGPLKKKPKVSL